jgi:hypothetical protein
MKVVLSDCHRWATVFLGGNPFALRHLVGCRWTCSQQRARTENAPRIGFDGGLGMGTSLQVVNGSCHNVIYCKPELILAMCGLHNSIIAKFLPAVTSK